MAYRIWYNPPGNSISWSMNWVDGDRTKVSVIDRERDGGTQIGVSFVSSFGCGRPIKPDFLPSQMTATKAIKKIPDIFNRGGGSKVVTQKFRDIVESFEPNVHQFFPVDLVTKAKKHIETIYIFIVCNRIDSVHPDKNENWIFREEYCRWVRRSKDRSLSVDERKFWKEHDPGRGRLILHRAKIGQRHVWVEKHISGQVNRFYSNQLAGALMEAELHHVSFFENGEC